MIRTLVFLAFIPALAHATELNGILKNNAGASAFNGKDGQGESGHAFQAFGDFTGALADLPYSTVVHFNIGNSFMRNKEFEKAISEYKEALIGKPDEPLTPAQLSALDRETKFRAAFNTGVAFTELKKNDEALAAYQAALEFKPESGETKTNIELLTQQQGGGGSGEDQQQQQNQDKNDKGQGKDKKPDDQKKDQKDKPDQDKDKDKDKKQQQPDHVENPKPSPHPFKSEDLSPQDVKRILEELKRQEEQIRTRMENDQKKESPSGKDW